MGVMTFLVSFSYIWYVPNFVKLGQVVSEKMLTDDGRHTTTNANHSNRSPAWLRWPRNAEVLISLLFPHDRTRKPVKVKDITLLSNFQYEADYKVAFKQYKVWTGHKIMKNKVYYEFPSVSVVKSCINSELGEIPCICTLLRVNEIVVFNISKNGR